MVKRAARDVCAVGNTSNLCRIFGGIMILSEVMSLMIFVSFGCRELFARFYQYMTYRKKNSYVIHLCYSFNKIYSILLQNQLATTFRGNLSDIFPHIFLCNFPMNMLI